MLLSALSGCQNKKKFDSAESMISELTGTYCALYSHTGERVIIDGSRVIKFDIDELFPQIVTDTTFWENFPNEDWETFDIDVLLNKPYINTEITIEPITVNIEKSTVSDLLVKKDGSLFSEEEEGYLLSKTSSDSIYPTAEMQEKFAEYLNYLQEYEKSAIIAEAESNFSQKKDDLESALSSATSSNSSTNKSTASADTIANCAFDSIMDYLKYPRTATMNGYSRSPQYDSYGRVATLITVTYQNGFGNYITEDVYVVLQSCSFSGHYTCKTNGSHYSTNKDHFSFLLIANDWDEDPDAEDEDEIAYKEAIKLIKNKDYSSAVSKLKALKDYKSSSALKDACVNYIAAETYNKAIKLFSEGKYDDASKQLTDLLESNKDDYLRAKRVIMLCAAGDDSDGSSEQPSAIEPSVTEPSVTKPSATEPSATQPPATQSPVTQTPASCSHNYSNATCTKPQTCTKCGATTGSAAGHTWKNATCTDPAMCTICQETYGSAKGHIWKDATCTAPKTCQTCKATEGSALPHDMYYTKCTKCDYSDFSEYVLTSNTFCSSSWFNLGDGTGSHYLKDGEASIQIDRNGVCNITFASYSYTFTLKQTTFYGNEPVFECYMNGEYVKNAKVTFYYSQNRCDFFLYGGTLGFSQVALNFYM